MSSVSLVSLSVKEWNVQKIFFTNDEMRTWIVTTVLMYVKDCDTFINAFMNAFSQENVSTQINSVSADGEPFVVEITAQHALIASV